MRLFEISKPSSAKSGTETSLNLEGQSLKDIINSFPWMSKNYKFDSSPLNFEKKTGIKVAQYYNMPENLSVKMIYHYLSSVLQALDRRRIRTAEMKARIEHLYAAVEKVNPKLKTIDGSSWINGGDSHKLTAVLSLFPFDDIKPYVEDGKTNRWYMNQPDWPERWKKINTIELLTGALITWVMSPKTLDRVYNEVLKKYPSKQTQNRY